MAHVQDMWCNIGRIIALFCTACRRSWASGFRTSNAPASHHKKRSSGCFEVGWYRKLWVRSHLLWELQFQYFLFCADEVPKCIWSNNLIHMVEVTPLVNIQLKMLSRSLCCADLSLLNRCYQKIRADPSVVVRSGYLSYQLMSGKEEMLKVFIFHIQTPIPHFCLLRVLKRFIIIIIIITNNNNII